MEGSGQLHASAALPLRRAPAPIEEEDGWTPELVWTIWITENPLPLPGMEPRIVQPAA